MDILRRKILCAVGGAAALPISSRLAWAQGYPDRPVRILVGYAAGGGVDISARMIGQWLSDRLGQQFVIENRPGAGTNVATEAVVRAPADGHTLLLVNIPNAINASLYDKLTFDFIRDITPVASMILVDLVMVVNPSFPARTVPEFIDFAKANPEKINFASGGRGGPDHLAGELFKMRAGVGMTHVPYRGLVPALSDLIGNQVQVVFSTMASAIEYIKAGQLRALAVTSATRGEAFPDIATMSEFLPGFQASQWYGIGAPRNTPADIVDRLNREINAALADPAMKLRVAKLGGSVLAGSPADFGRFIAAETERWAQVVKFAGARAE